MDQITIKDLEVYANHGLYKEEKAKISGICNFIA